MILRVKKQRIRWDVILSHLKSRNLSLRSKGSRKLLEAVTELASLAKEGNIAFYTVHTLRRE